MIGEMPMPVIKPISDLRNKFTMISKICHEDHVPIFLTKNGEGDLVVMSIEDYEKQQALFELYQKLGEAESESVSKKATIEHDELMDKLRSRVNARKKS
jgi:prevent-host-death family protein